MRTRYALGILLFLVLALATHATAICRGPGCHDPGDSDPRPLPPPPQCTNGATRNCSAGNGCPGTQTCVNGAWSACADVGQCAARLGCPVSRETINMEVAPHSMACTPYMLAKPGERINVRTSEFPPAPLYLHRQGSGDPSPLFYGLVDNFPVSYYGNYAVCAQNANNSALSIRITMDVVGNESPSRACDQRPDTCFGARGPGCTLCLDTGRQDNLVWCWVSVGSQKHDTCCAYQPGGHWCGNVGYTGGYVGDQYCQWQDALPGDYDHPYRWCTAEFDRGAADFAGGYEWAELTDPTLLSYRPLANYATRTSDGHWLDGGPTAESIQAPDGEALRLGDGAWCTHGSINVWLPNGLPATLCVSGE